ncbi:MAG: PKD domain-containing protein [Actinomycetes bacterium]
MRSVVSWHCSVFVILAQVNTALASQPPECIGYLGTKTCAGGGDGGFGVGVGRGPWHRSGKLVGQGGQLYGYEFVLTCPTNNPNGRNDPCGPATGSCGSPNLFRYWLFRRPVDAHGAPTGPWLQLPGAFCRGPVQAITPSDIAAVFRWRFVPITPSTTHFNPANGTLVNIKTIFYADTPRTMRTTVTLLGEPVALTLHPTRWTWHFGDGTTLTTFTPGAPYPDTSVTHNYTKTGRYAASVTVTWDGTFTFGGRSASIPGDTSTVGPPATVTVREAHSHLVGG